MHELESDMVSLSFGDTLELDDGDQLEIVNAMGGLVWFEDALKRIPTDESNLVARALRLLGEKARVRLLKRIPPGSGLGGGSSNAAAILRYFEGAESDAEAPLLGADVPFCLRGGRAVVRGIGEVLEPLEYQFETFVLLLSPFGVSTQEVYRHYDLMKRDAEGGANDLERAALSCEARLVRSRKVLRTLSGEEPILAGSGSTYFISGTFEHLELSASPVVAEGFRYADITVDGSCYRLIETSTLPELT
jgi:4-diphosphocytidyl-2-C-methyl-D-erythritol kinase